MMKSFSQRIMNLVSKIFNPQLYIRITTHICLVLFGISIGVILSSYLQYFPVSIQPSQLLSKNLQSNLTPQLQPTNPQFNQSPQLEPTNTLSNQLPKLQPIKPKPGIAEISNTNTCTATPTNVTNTTVTTNTTNATSSTTGDIGLTEYPKPPSTMHDMSDAELLKRASVSPKIHEVSFVQVPKVAFLFLTKGPVHLAPLWQKFFQGHEGYYSIYVHSNPSYNGSDPESPVFHGRRIPSKVVTWGKVNMVEAERRLLANALLDISNQRFALLSESCIPLFNFTTIYNYLIHSTQSFVMAEDEPGPTGRGRYHTKMKPLIRLKQWRKGSQWFEMDRDLAIEVVSDKKYFPVFQKYCKNNCYADEHYLPTFVSIKFWRRNSNRSLTYVEWTKGSPHPNRFVRPHVTPEFLEKLRNNKTCKYNGETTHVCDLFARKFLPDALTRLLVFAPRVMHFH